jgi:hypothetical protein
MKNYRFDYKDGRVEYGQGWSGLDAWHRLGHATFWRCQLICTQEL